MPEYLVQVQDKIFETIFKHASDGIAIVGTDFRWITVNQSLIDMLGYSEEEFTNMTFVDITHKDDLGSDMQLLDQLIDGIIDKYYIEKRYFHKSGSIIWAMISISMVVDNDDLPLYFIAQISNITKRKEIERQMSSILDIVKKQNEKLLDFAHIATHDIRTHLGNLKTITGFIQEESEFYESDDNFKMLKGSLGQLESTLTHLNDVRKHHLSTDLNLKSLDLGNFVDSAIYNVYAIARSQNFKIINQVNSGVKVLATEVFLDSIILNLLTNAIKYSSNDRESYVRLTTSTNADYVILQFEDNGLGIDLNKHSSSLFKFEKTFHDNEDSRGIGLFITKNHLENLGGKIEVESEVNVGSRFKIYFRRV